MLHKPRMLNEASLLLMMTTPQALSMLFIDCMTAFFGGMSAGRGCRLNSDVGVVPRRGQWMTSHITIIKPSSQLHVPVFGRQGSTLYRERCIAVRGASSTGGKGFSCAALRANGSTRQWIMGSGLSFF
ncbi:hypothetical protein Micbo1qcDRAFT_10705 [Microdochium bolleyi]|uniref:Uncharacterized protein n=1 Tax=Microdochium bolleyi TaxID=196109 RepID=A0A136IYA5_9PEZI|nr:hypothetical protein Micbo1qcDRAFT_10705 [Microdochium bolleyi]